MKRTVLMMTILGWSAALCAQAPPPPPAAVEVAVASQEQVAPLLWSPAGVVSRGDARVAAEQSGRVVELAEIGEQIKAGGVLARIDDRLLRLAVDEARAALGRVAARLDYARAQEQRLAQLARQATVSTAQADEAAAERRMLEQDQLAAEVALRQAQQRLEHAVVRAPFAGTVVERLVAEGEFLAPGVAVLRLVDTERVEVQARAPVALAGLIDKGQSVALRMAGQDLQGAVRAVVPVGDGSSRQFEVRVELDGAALPIGSALEVGLPSEAPRQALTVPRDALVLRPGQRYVVRVGADDTAERVAVTTGGSVGDRIEVAGDLQPGDLLVVRGAERVQPGQKLTIGNRLEDDPQVAGGL